MLLQSVVEPGERPMLDDPDELPVVGLPVVEPPMLLLVVPEVPPLDPVVPVEPEEPADPDEPEPPAWASCSAWSAACEGEETVAKAVISATALTAYMIFSLIMRVSFTKCETEKDQRKKVGGRSMRNPACSQKFLPICSPHAHMFGVA